MSSISAKEEQMIMQTVFSVLDEWSNTPASVSLTLDTAGRMAGAAVEEAARLGVAIVVSVVDASGRPILLQRMDDALLVSLKLAEDKAFTAVALRKATHELAAACQPGQSLYGLQHQDRMVIFGGGIPCWIRGSLAGAVGVSGGTVEQDIRIASYALESLSKGTV